MDRYLRKTLLNKGNSYVVDFQAFKNNVNNKFILKELAIVALNSDVVVHCIIKPPTSYSSLDTEMQKRVDYLTAQYHGLKWDDGFINFPDAINLLRYTVNGAALVYIKGSERAKYLSKLLPHEIYVVDLDRIGCPRAYDWPPSPADELELMLDCPYHQHQYCQSKQVHELVFHCALRMALTYRDWVKYCTVSSDEEDSDNDSVITCNLSKE